MGRIKLLKSKVLFREESPLKKRRRRRSLTIMKLLTARVALLASAMLLTCAMAKPKLSEKLVYVKFQASGRLVRAGVPAECTGWYRRTTRNNTEVFYTLVGKLRLMGRKFTIEQHNSMWQLFEGGKCLNEGKTLPKRDTKGCKSRWWLTTAPTMKNCAPFLVARNGPARGENDTFVFVESYGATIPEVKMLDRVTQVTSPQTALVEPKNKFPSEEVRSRYELLLRALLDEYDALHRLQLRSQEKQKQRWFQSYVDTVDKKTAAWEQREADRREKQAAKRATSAKPSVTRELIKLPSPPAKQGSRPAKSRPRSPGPRQRPRPAKRARGSTTAEHVKQPTYPIKR